MKLPGSKVPRWQGATLGKQKPAVPPQRCHLVPVPGGRTTEPQVSQTHTFLPEVNLHAVCSEGGFLGSSLGLSHLRTPKHKEKHQNVNIKKKKKKNKKIQVSWNVFLQIPTWKAPGDLPRQNPNYRKSHSVLCDLFKVLSFPKNKIQVLKHLSKQFILLSWLTALASNHGFI